MTRDGIVLTIFVVNPHVAAAYQRNLCGRRRAGAGGNPDAIEP
jgi:hypothetical protein